MNVTIISGSHRPDSQSLKVANWLAGALKLKTHDTEIISLSGNPFPLWDESAWNEGSDLSKQMKPSLDKVTNADALIVIAPEWGGMAPGGLKNFLLYIASQHAAHKPTMLVGVSASRGGTYPIAELRMSGFKNNRMLYTPDHLIVQGVENVMNDHDMDTDDKNDGYIKKRAHYSLDVLMAYAKALKPMREENEMLKEEYPFGM